jgi:hypothetical protein
MNEWQGKQKYLEETCSSAALSTTNPTLFDPGSNSGLRGGRPANNSLRTALPSVSHSDGTYILFRLCSHAGKLN